MPDGLNFPEIAQHQTCSDSSTFPPGALPRGAGPTPRVVVAIPVCNEVAQIGACLRAVAWQHQAAAERIVLLLNGCTDGTEALVRSMAPSLPVDVTIIERNLRGSEATAGFARSLALRYAAADMNDEDVLMTTDADSRVSPDWIATNLSAIAHGADAVCGRAVIDPDDAKLIPAHLHEDDARECAFGGLLDEMAALLDPNPDDPWPRHTEHSGASLAFTVAAWRHAGGMPPVPSGEDRAFVARLQEVDARIRHAPSAWVTVSGRTQGRAAGGMADTIRRRIVCQDEFIDSALEPAAHRYRRVCLRARARAVWLDGGFGAAKLAEACHLPTTAIIGALANPFFGRAWAMIERDSPVLRIQPVRFVDLHGEIAQARAICDGIRGPAVAPARQQVAA